MVAITVTLTGTPKRNLLEMAFENCGSAGFEFERTPEELGSALRKLNAMMYEWPWNLLPYNQPTYGSGVVDDFSGVPNDAIAAVAMTLALRIAPTMGATLSPEASAELVRSRSIVEANYAVIPTQYMGDDTVAGAGNRRFFPYYNETPAS
jgi:hypothetical protein